MTDHKNAEACGCDYGVEPPWLCDVHRTTFAMPTPAPAGWIGVDLDGTLAIYDERTFPAIGPPIEVMVARVKQWIVEGKDVRIFTARVGIRPAIEADLHFAADQEALIQTWCLEQFGIELPVTAQKDFQMIELWDDRCVQMVTNTGQRADEVTPEELVEQREWGHSEGQVRALREVLALKRHLVAVTDPPFVKMEEVIRVADIEQLRKR